MCYISIHLFLFDAAPFVGTERCSALREDRGGDCSHPTTASSIQERINVEVNTYGSQSVMQQKCEINETCAHRDLVIRSIPCKIC